MGQPEVSPARVGPVHPGREAGRDECTRSGIVPPGWTKCTDDDGCGHVKHAPPHRLHDHPLDLPAANGHDLDRELQAVGLRVFCQPGLCGAAHAPELLRADHLERVAEALALLPLDLGEDDRATATDDQVDFVPARPDVPAQHSIAAQQVVQRRELLAGYAAAKTVSASRSA